MDPEHPPSIKTLPRNYKEHQRMVNMATLLHAYFCRPSMPPCRVWSEAIRTVRKRVSSSTKPTSDASTRRELQTWPTLTSKKSSEPPTSLFDRYYCFPRPPTMLTDNLTQVRVGKHRTFDASWMAFGSSLHHRELSRCILHPQTTHNKQILLATNLLSTPNTMAIEERSTFRRGRPSPLDQTRQRAIQPELITQQHLRERKHTNN